MKRNNKPTTVMDIINVLHSAYIRRSEVGERKINNTKEVSK